MGIAMEEGMRSKPWVNFEKVMRLLRIEELPKSLTDDFRIRTEKERIPSTRELIEGANEALITAKTLRTAGRYPWAFVSAYCSVFQTVRALNSNAGIFVPMESDYSAFMRVVENYDRVMMGALEMKPKSISKKRKHGKVIEIAPDITEELMWLTLDRLRNQRNGAVHVGLNHISRKTVNETIKHAEALLTKSKMIIE